MTVTSEQRADAAGTATRPGAENAIRPEATLAEAVAQLATVFTTEGEKDPGHTILVALDPHAPETDVVVGAEGGQAVLSPRARQAILECIRRETVGQFEDRRNGTRTIVAPVDGPSPATWALVRTDAADAGDRRGETEHAASLLSVWLGRRVEPTNDAGRIDSVIVATLGEVEGTVRERAVAIAEALRSTFGAPFVAIGWKPTPTSSAEVVALATAATGHLDGEGRTAVGEAIDEGFLRGEGAEWTPGAERDRPALLKHARLGVVLDLARVTSVPLTDESGSLRGVLLHGGREGGLTGMWTGRADRVGRALGRHLDLAARAEPTFVSRSLDSLRQAPWRAWLVAAAAVLTLLVWPVSHSVSCNCTIEPVRRRYVAAPFDGVLARVHARPGDPVAAGQLLAEMDGREVQLSLSERDAEYHRARQQQRMHAAAQDFAEARVAALEMDRIDAERELLRQRLQQLRVTSSLDGVVLEGEFDKAEGVRLDKGQSLFEIGPLDRMVVEVEIPASEIAHVRDDAEVSVRLENGGGAALSGRLARIRPRSEIRADEHVFVGEFEVENADRTLRPGTTGRAAIREATRPLGWVLFHRAWDRVRLGWIGWWS